MADAVTIVVAVLTAIVYALYFYWKYAPEDEPFQKKKLVRTVIVGALVGGLLWYSGIGVTLDTFLVQARLIEQAGGGFLIVIIDQAVAWLFKKAGW